MNYRELLEISKNCPKCCSNSLERLLEKYGEQKNVKPTNNIESKDGPSKK